MATKSITRSNNRIKLMILPVLVLFLIASGLISIRLVTGRGLGLRSIPRNLLSVGLAVLNNQEVKAYSRGNFSNIIFLHHSTGENLINQGHVRERFSEAGFSFWDQGYNNIGLRDPKGEFTGYAYPVPRDNTDPDGLARVFSQKEYSLPLNSLSGLLQHEVIIIKSCFTPTSNIDSEQKLVEYKDYYEKIRVAVDTHPDKIFILLTQPPLNPAETNTGEAIRARALSSWLEGDEYQEERPNLFVFDLFDYLAIDDSSSPEFSMLRQEYRNGTDSHPNQNANEKIGPILVDFVINAINTFQPVPDNSAP